MRRTRLADRINMLQQQRRPEVAPSEVEGVDYPYEDISSYLEALSADVGKPRRERAPTRLTARVPEGDIPRNILYDYLTTTATPRGVAIGGPAETAELIPADRARGGGEGTADAAADAAEAGEERPSRVSTEATEPEGPGTKTMIAQEALKRVPSVRAASQIDGPRVNMDLPDGPVDTRTRQQQQFAELVDSLTMDDLTDEARILGQAKERAVAGRKAATETIARGGFYFAGLDPDAVKAMNAMEATIRGVDATLSPEEGKIIARIIVRKALNEGIDPLSPAFAVEDPKSIGKGAFPHKNIPIVNKLGPFGGFNYHGIERTTVRRLRDMIRNSPSTVKNVLLGAPGAVIRGGSALASGIASVPGAVETGVKSFYALPRAAKLAAIRKGLENMGAVSPAAEVLLATTEASTVAIQQMLRQIYGTPLEQLPNMARTARRPLRANDELLFTPVERRPDYVAQAERSPLGEETATGYVNPTDLYRAIIMDLAKKDYTREVEPLIITMLGEEEGGPIGLARLIPEGYGIEGTQILTPDLAMQILADVLLVQDAVKKKAGAN